MVKFILFSLLSFVACKGKISEAGLMQSDAESIDSSKSRLLADFEVLLMCHCQEYFTQRVFQGASEKFLNENKGQIFYGFVRSASYNQYYSEKFKKSLIFRQPYSVVWGTNYNYYRIDSLYFNPMYKYYISVFERTAHYPNQIGDLNYIYDCYHRIKEIPLEKELKEFMKINEIEGDINFK